MPYTKISRHEMLKMLHFAHVEFDTLVAHRDHTFTLRVCCTTDRDRARRASVGKLCKTTRAILLDERGIQRGELHTIEIRFAYQD